MTTGPVVLKVVVPPPVTPFQYPLLVTVIALEDVPAAVAPNVVAAPTLKATPAEELPDAVRLIAPELEVMLAAAIHMPHPVDVPVEEIFISPVVEEIELEP